MTTTWCAYPIPSAKDDDTDDDTDDDDERVIALRRVRAPRCVVTFGDAVPTVTRGADVEDEDTDDTDDDDASSLVLCDVEIDVKRGRIRRVQRHAPTRGRRGEDATTRTIDVDARGAVTWPCFADIHTHIDKAHTCERSANIDGSLQGADDACTRDAVYWSVDDCKRRMEFALKCAYFYGTSALRTHVMSGPTQGAHAWEAFRQLRREWMGKIELQGVSFSVLSFFRDEARARELARDVSASGGILGCAVSCSDAGGTELDDITTCGDEMHALLDVVFSIATEFGLDLDFHVDENGNVESRGLLHIAQAAMRNNFQGSIVCGHCCALAVQPDDVAKEIIEATRKANITVVSLPQVNQWLQNRDPHGELTPRWRGVTRVKELAAAGVPVCLASDNTRDQFFAYGDCDMLEVFRTSIFIAHLDRCGKDRTLASWPLSVSVNPARAMRLDKTFGRIAPGAKADFILFHARTYSELFSRPQHDRVLIRNGVRVQPQLPEYAELDDLNAKCGDIDKNTIPA